jgi:serine protease
MSKNHFAIICGLSLTGVLLAGVQAWAMELSPSSPRAKAAADAAVSAAAAPAAAAPPAAQTSRIRVKYREGPQAASAAPPLDAGAVVAQSSTATIQSRTAHPERNAEDIVLDRAVNEQELARIAEGIARNPSVEYAVPEKIERAQQVVNDTRFSEQWHYQQEKVGIRLPQAWTKATGKGVIVGVLDTGIRKHADLVDHIMSGFDMVDNASKSNDGDGRDSDPTDPGDWCPSEFTPSSWHGTHVAGTIAAVTNNGVGVAGVARDARILPVRVLGQCGGSSFDITDGIRWAAGAPVTGIPTNPNPARVINLSLGGLGPCDADYADAIRQARQRGVTVVVAAGNSDIDASGFRPANCDGVISVAATNKRGARAYFGRPGSGSNFGTSVKIAAPGGETAVSGEGILSTLNDGIREPGNDSYEFYQGSSMAAPHVTGVVALMYEVYPKITPDEVLSILRATSQPFPVVASRQCDITTCGAGIVNAEAAVSEAISRAAKVSDAAAGPVVSSNAPNNPRPDETSRPAGAPR